ncbi:MAG: hypothetical protein LBU27_06225 [Candidatus Peribacteria bacterium]|jgi:hypothetical protein|nr:hypothetical protein [Candidatus Peribacteria bacterium]
MRENEWFITNKVHFNKEGTRETVHNLTHFPNVKHDDPSDAFIILITPASATEISEIKELKTQMKKFEKRAVN